MREVCVITSLAGVKNKGLWKLAGRSLVDWNLRTAATLWETLVSTDQVEVIEQAQRRGASVALVPEAFRSGNHHVEQALAALKSWVDDEDIIHLMQPSSPFIRRSDIVAAGKVMQDLKWSSAQTVIPVPHNFHAWNQREFDGSKIDFANKWERAVNPTKQTKPLRFAFGNLVSVRYGALKEQGTFFATPSLGRSIPKPFGLDVDALEDLEMAEIYLSGGLVSEKEILA